MQRHLPDFNTFLDWKDLIEAEGHYKQETNLRPVINPDGFVKRSPILPVFLPLEKPSTMMLEGIMKRPRSRRLDVDDILTRARGIDNGGTLHLLVTEVVRSRSKKFSQVVFGRLRWTSLDGTTLWRRKLQFGLRMFDETLFPVPG